MNKNLLIIVDLGYKWLKKNYPTKLWDHPLDDSITIHKNTNSKASSLVG